MAINQPGFASTPMTEVTDVTIQIVDIRPVPNVDLDDEVLGGVMVGYFNNRSGFVELFVSNESGTQWIEIS